MARALNGTSDKILMALGSVPTSLTAFTLAAIVRLNAVSRWNNLITLATSGDVLVADMTVTNLNELMTESGGARATVTGIGTGWQLFAISKASGNTIVRGHRYVFSTGVWTHTNAAASDGDPSGTVARPYLGAAATVDFMQGDIAAAAVFASALSDPAIENLPFTLQAWFAANPAALWLLDQAATTQKIKDFVGGADESTLTGTTVATASVPVFNISDGVWMPTVKPPGGAVVTFDAVVAGVGAVSTTLARERAIIPVVAGAGSVAVAVARERAIAATVDGQGVIAPVDMARIRELIVPASGQGAVTADILVPKLLTADVAGQGSIVVQADRTRALIASAAGNGAVAADLARQLSLAATVAGQGAVVAALNRDRALIAAVAGQGAITAPLARIRALEVNPVTGAAAIVVDITVTGAGIVSFAATITGQGAVTVALARTRGLAADISGQGTISPAMAASKKFVAAVQAVAQIAVALSIVGQKYLTPKPIDTIALASEVEGTIALLTAVEGTIALASAVPGTIALTPQVPGTLVLVGAGEEDH